MKEKTHSDIILQIAKCNKTQAEILAKEILKYNSEEPTGCDFFIAEILNILKQQGLIIYEIH